MNESTQQTATGETMSQVSPERLAEIERWHDDFVPNSDDEAFVHRAVADLREHIAATKPPVSKTRHTDRARSATQRSAVRRMFRCLDRIRAADEVVDAGEFDLDFDEFLALRDVLLSLDPEIDA